MITVNKLMDNFYPVDVLDGNLIRCCDEFPKKTRYFYFSVSIEYRSVPFVISEDLIDDEFAAQVLAGVCSSGVSVLIKTEAMPNQYGFSHVLYVPHNYHSELKGRLDADRPKTTLCIPIFNSEFSGSETVEAFIELRRSIVPTCHWKRSAAPKIALRFDNTRTKGGTGDAYVFVDFDLVLREIDELVGVSDGFIEIVNYRDAVVEILFSGEDLFTWIQDRDDAAAVQVAKNTLSDRLWAFLTQ